VETSRRAVITGTLASGLTGMGERHAGAVTDNRVLRVAPQADLKILDPF
jgi:hypothetical protein